MILAIHLEKFQLFSIRKLNFIACFEDELVEAFFLINELLFEFCFMMFEFAFIIDLNLFLEVW